MNRTLLPFIYFSFQIFALTGPAVGTTVATATGGGVTAGNLNIYFFKLLT